MKQKLLIVLVIVLVSVVSLASMGVEARPTVFDSPLSNTIFLPVVLNNWRYGYVPGNLLCNPSAELGEFCWQFTYPGSGNVLCDCDGEDCPPPTDGDCEFRFAGWHNMIETGQTAEFLMEKETIYRFDFDMQIWSDEISLDPQDTLDVYLVTPSGHHHLLLEFHNMSQDQGRWFTRGVSISPGTTGTHSILFVAITDEDKGKPWPGNTNFFIDNLILQEWGECTECVQCQVLDEPVEEFCDQGQGADCNGAQPQGGDCVGLDPQCPALPPPHLYREVGRYCSYNESLEMELTGWTVGHTGSPPLRSLPASRP